MATVLASMSMSVDGFVAEPSDAVGPLFDWYAAGDVVTGCAGPVSEFRTSPRDAEHLRGLFAEVGACLFGRRTFEYADGWTGGHPFGVPVVVLTHAVPTGWPRADSPCEFVTEGIEAAVGRAAELAGDRTVGVAGGDMVRQALAADLLDEIAIDLVPVVLGSGIRFFGDVAGPRTMLDDPSVVPGTRVTHLRYRVRRS